jgi:hypothetical protein
LRKASRATTPESLRKKNPSASRHELAAAAEAARRALEEARVELSETREKMEDSWRRENEDALLDELLQSAAEAVSMEVSQPMSEIRIVETAERENLQREGLWDATWANMLQVLDEGIGSMSVAMGEDAAKASDRGQEDDLQQEASESSTCMPSPSRTAPPTHRSNGLSVTAPPTHRSTLTAPPTHRSNGTPRRLSCSDQTEEAHDSVGSGHIFLMGEAFDRNCGSWLPASSRGTVNCGAEANEKSPTVHLDCSAGGAEGRLGSRLSTARLPVADAELLGSASEALREEIQALKLAEEARAISEALQQDDAEHAEAGRRLFQVALMMMLT